MVHVCVCIYIYTYMYMCVDVYPNENNNDIKSVSELRCLDKLMRSVEYFSGA